MTLRVGSLFSGVGGMDSGFEDEGFEIAWQCEIDPAARGVLDYLYPKVPKFADIRDCGRHNLSPVDVLVGGFPCTDLSVAGARAGLQDGKTRSGLFFEMIRVIEELQPTWVVFENVPGLLSQYDEVTHSGRCICGWHPGWRGMSYCGSRQAREHIHVSRACGDDRQGSQHPPKHEGDVRGQSSTDEATKQGLGAGVFSILLGQGGVADLVRDTAAPDPEASTGSTAHRVGGDQEPGGHGQEEGLDAVAQDSRDVHPNNGDGSQPQGAGADAAGSQLAGVCFCEGCGRDLSQASNPRPSRRHAMGAVLRAFSQRGYVGSWRVVDAQMFGVPQRRARVFGAFTRGHLGAERAAEILAFPGRLSGHSAKGRKAKADVAAPLTGGTPGSGPGCGEDAASGHLVVGTLDGGSGSRGYRIGAEDASKLVVFGRNNTSGPLDTAACLTHHGSRLDFESETFVIQDCRAGEKNQNGLGITPDGPAYTLQANNHQGVVYPASGITDTITSTDGPPSVGNLGRVVCVTSPVTHTLTHEGADASEDGTGRGTPIVAFGCRDSDPKASEGISPTLRSMTGEHANGGGQVAVAAPNPLYYTHDYNQDRVYGIDAVSPALCATRTGGSTSFLVPNDEPQFIVRRLLPIECERLQGWADDTTLRKIKKGKVVEQADAPRYRQVGNGVVRPVARYIARRLKKVMEDSTR